MNLVLVTARGEEAGVPLPARPGFLAAGLPWGHGKSWGRFIKVTLFPTLRANRVGMGVYPRGRPMVGWRMGTRVGGGACAGATGGAGFKSLDCAAAVVEPGSDLASDVLCVGGVRLESTFRAWPG